MEISGPSVKFRQIKHESPTDRIITGILSRKYALQMLVDYRDAPSTTDSVQFAQEQVMASFHDCARIRKWGVGWGDVSTSGLLRKL